MPIYAYRCTNCGFEKDFLQKMSDKPLTKCPQCGKDALVKELSAPGFELRGTGWAATDFNGGPKTLPASPPQPSLLYTYDAPGHPPSVRLGGAPTY